VPGPGRYPAAARDAVLLQSFDFVAAHERLAEGTVPGPVRARLAWQLHEIVHRAFTVFDVDGSGEMRVRSHCRFRKRGTESLRE
jgi:hypothetical protein